MARVSGRLSVNAPFEIYRGLSEALRVPESDLRLFGKPEAFIRRRIGVAVANGRTFEEARERAKRCASVVKPVKA